MKTLEYEKLKQYDEKYGKDENNKIIEEQIKKIGIDKFCINDEILNKDINYFNIELPKSKVIYDQKSSERCAFHAIINMIKSSVAESLNINDSDFKISINYLVFLDKLEKTNIKYEKIIQNNNFNFEKEMKEGYLNDPIAEASYFHQVRSLINKYGIVPESIMPDVFCSDVSSELTSLLNEKVKKDIFKLLQMKQDNIQLSKIYKQKEKMLEENYIILCKCLGQLPFKFDYEYEDKDGNIIILKDITPIEFANRFLKIDLNNMVCIANLPMYNKKYYKLYRRKHTETVNDSQFVEFVNMPIDVLKDLAIKQLKDGIPVIVGCEVRKMRERNLGILDSSLYNYEDVFGIKLLTKYESLSMNHIVYQHDMIITGVHIEDNKSVRWKIEDSYGDKIHKEGYYIMSDKFFDDFVLCIIVDQKYLSEEQKELFTQESILFDIGEPF